MVQGAAPTEETRAQNQACHSYACFLRTLDRPVRGGMRFGRGTFGVLFRADGWCRNGVVGAKGGDFAWGRRNHDWQVSNTFLAGQARAGVVAPSPRALAQGGVLVPGVSHPEGITRSSLVFRSGTDVKHTAQSFGPACSSSLFPIRHVRTAFYNEALFGSYRFGVCSGRDAN